MNLFRSEEHVTRWLRYSRAGDDYVMPVAEWADIFSNPFFRERGRAGYISWTRSEAGAQAFKELRTRLPRASS